jgi:aspartyl-tRNA(Asn)/glutamyl-tRNA(Gln) amidotransferase subunit C
MLAPVRRIVIVDDRRRGSDGFGDVYVDRCHAERRLESTRAHDRDAIEPDEMRRSDEHHDVEASIAQQTIRVRRDRAGILQTGVRRHERDEIATDVGLRLRKIAIDGCGQSLRGSRIPTSGDRRGPDRCHPYIVESVMPGAFTREQVEAIAALASLELDASELELFARQMSDFLAYADQVRQLDTSGVAPTAYVARLHPGDREDVVQPSLDRRDVLANAPEADLDAGLFKVPRVLG